MNKQDTERKSPQIGPIVRALITYLQEIMQRCNITKKDIDTILVGALKLNQRFLEQSLKVYDLKIVKHLELIMDFQRK